MRRYFTVDQAQGLLTEITESLNRIKALHEVHKQAAEEIQETARRVVQLGGVRIDLQRLAALKNRRDSSAVHIKEALESIQSHGCVVKDLDAGLIDFPALFKGKEVYLCWQLGERGIGYWHGLEEGFRGRKLIDRDFLAHHKPHKPGTDGTFS
ncbi:MAG: DUF2203 domain-containing protein [Acidobacteriales bacterium]|nr:DUF2203 domain-containing protein [Terriglobales bacterium]